jgi:hypothetical protein
LIELETGASESHIDLSGAAERCRSRPAPADGAHAIRQAGGTCPVRIEGGATSVEAPVPPVEVSCVESGWRTQAHRPRFFVPGGFQTAGYAGATDRLEIKVSMGLGAPGS